MKNTDDGRFLAYEVTEQIGNLARMMGFDGIRYYSVPDRLNKGISIAIIVR